MRNGHGSLLVLSRLECSRAVSGVNGGCRWPWLLQDTDKIYCLGNSMLRKWYALDVLNDSQWRLIVFAVHRGSFPVYHFGLNLNSKSG